MPRLPFSCTRRPNSEKVISRTRPSWPVVFNVWKKRADRVGQVGQQVAVRGALVGVGVEAVEADVEDARAEALGDQAGDRVAASGRGRRPAAARHSVPPAARAGVSTAVSVCTCRRCTNETRSSSAALPGRRRQLLQQPAAGLLLRDLAATQLEAEGVLVVDGDRPAPRRPGHGQRQAARADVQDGHPARVVVALDRGPAQPAGRDVPLGSADCQMSMASKCERSGFG